MNYCVKIKNIKIKDLLLTARLIGRCNPPQPLYENAFDWVAYK